MLNTRSHVQGIPAFTGVIGQAVSLSLPYMAIFPIKEDQCIEILASEAVKAGYSILSFDLPAHGERRHVESEYHVT
ncbi:hypothetical protein [Pantoea ananatis]|uniref:hypothetical protein n=1 Tax=Pantoea ananas TaxID=553 RepID=UPI0021639A6B|nr:hypothetical protein [Pantoea ananatis]